MQSANSESTGHAHEATRGCRDIRLLFRKTPKTEWKRIGYYLSSVTGTRGDEITEINPSDPANLEVPFEVDFNFTDDSFLDWSSKKEKVRLQLPTVSIVTVDPDKQEGSKPIQLGPPLDLVYQLKLTLPAKYQTRVPIPSK